MGPAMEPINPALLDTDQISIDRCRELLGDEAIGLSDEQVDQIRRHADFPLRGYVRCEACGRPLTASWSKGRSDYYAYYHCRPGCRASNIAKTKLEDMFVDELTRLQPTPGFMRLVKDRVLHA